MIKYFKVIEIIISVQLIIISTFIPVYLSIPFTSKVLRPIELPITWQVPIIIILTLIFRRDIVIKAFSIYLIIGLFFIPVFHQGGSLGYLLTPNFGYLLGMYPLITIIDNLNRNKKINYINFLKNGVLGIISMHLIGMIYVFIQTAYYKQSDLFFYSIAKYSFGNFGFHLLMLTPITLLIKLKKMNNMR